jgi:hypothetical protein
MLALIFIVSLAGTAPHCPAAVQLRRALGVSGRGWTTKCNVAKDGRLLFAGVRPSPSPDAGATVAAAVTSLDGTTIRTQLPLAWSEAPFAREVLQSAEDWQVAISPVASDRSLLRLGVYVSHGDDLFVGQEIVTFLRSDGGALAPLWMGLGDRVDRRFDLCLLESTAAFAFLSGGRLERRTATRRAFVSEDKDDDTERLRRECVAPPSRTDVFEVARESSH